MVTAFKVFLILLLPLLVQNKAFSYGKNSEKVRVSVSVSKTDKSGDKSTEAKTEDSASKSLESNTTSSKNKSISNIAEKNSAKNFSNENSYSYDDNDNSSDGFYGKNKIGIKSYKKFELVKQERLFDAIKNFKNEKNISEANLEKLDNLVNKRIKEIAKKIKFKFDKDDEKQLFEFTKNTRINIDKIEKKAELVDYVQKTFEVMGLIN